MYIHLQIRKQGKCHTKYTLPALVGHIPNPNTVNCELKCCALILRLRHFLRVLMRG